MIYNDLVLTIKERLKMLKQKIKNYIEQIQDNRFLDLEEAKEFAISAVEHDTIFENILDNIPEKVKYYIDHYRTSEGFVKYDKMLIAIQNYIESL